MQEKTYIQTKDYLVSGEEFDLVWAVGGKALRTVPAPEDPAPYYETPQYISHTDGASSISEKLYQGAKRINLWKKRRLIESFAGPKGALLDIGAGTGDFVRYMGGRGWQTFGIEPSPAARGRAAEKGVGLYTGLQEVNGSLFDVITLWHVLEHLPDPEGSLRDISGLLKPGGWLVLALPNFRSLDARHYKSYWAAYDVPRHLWHFSREAIPPLVEPFGYRLVSVRPLWLDAFYISWMSEKYRGSAVAPLKGMFWGAVSNLFGCFQKEYSSHIYILHKADKSR
ncbi:class I SAM-dependent methyltransferase [Robiginitalea marina]|uniref:Class I SAM-dependent methyltransferase n=1 Tax=Robiginitalea marina TaxID=2954105 RepID=A0ABT1AXV5_9FLAO|nr:class I SAM-dependent methyltransferase [Robiginitalea marina]MCO5724208.1 class I SAM-dependent methyltransferase [Robiginitalea marina]